MQAFLDTEKPLVTHYGAIQGINALGTQVVESLLLEPYPHSNMLAYYRYHFDESDTAAHDMAH